MALYTLQVYCRRNGISQDAGEQARGDYPDDKTAIEKLVPEVESLRYHYDEVYWGVYKDGKKIAGKL